MARPWVKETVRQDKFTQTFFRIFSWSKKHKENMLIGGIVLILIAIFIPLNISRNRNLEQEAAQKLSSATFAYYQGNIEQAIALFQEITERYSRTSTCPLAFYYWGNLLYEIGDYQQAETIFNKFLDRYPKHAIYPQVLLNLGYTYEQMGNSDKAAEVYQKFSEQFPYHFLIEEAEKGILRVRSFQPQVEIYGEESNVENIENP